MSLILYDLVKSMTLNEKAHFRRNAKTHSSKEDKNYLKIYSVIDKAKAFDKNLLSDHFKGTAVEKHLSSEVSYLKERILISLFNFNMNNTKRKQIQKGILITECLADKGFQKEALKKLKRVKKIALKQEEFTLILRIIELEELLIFKEGILGHKEKLEQLHQQRSEAIDIIKNLNSYQIIREEIRELQFEEDLLQDDKNVKAIANNPLIVSDKKCMSIKAKEQWFYIQVLISYLKWDFKAGLNTSAMYVDFVNKNNYLFDSHKTLPALSNYFLLAAICGDKKHYKLAKKLLIEKSKEKQTLASAAYIKYVINARSLEYANNTNDKLLAQEYLTKTIDIIEHHSHEYEESQLQNFFTLIVRATIGLKQYDKGAHYSNLWHRRGILSYRKVQARLFSIILHLELDYLELLSSEIVLLKKLEKQFFRDKMLIRIFHKFVKSILKHPEKRTALTLDFQQDLLAFSKKSKGYFLWNSFDYYQWSLGLS